VLEEATVEGDGERLDAALDALIENAVDHTEVGTSIEVSACVESSKVIVAVKDSGPGIAPGDLERVFGRFARVDAHRNRETGGVGLGLAIAKAIVEAHHGSVAVQSIMGKGSVFEMILPTAPRRLARHHGRSSTGTHAPVAN